MERIDGDEVHGAGGDGAVALQGHVFLGAGHQDGDGAVLLLDQLARELKAAADPQALMDQQELQPSPVLPGAAF